MGSALARGLAAVGLRPNADVAEVVRGYASLADPDRRAAFLATLRSVIHTGGQRVHAGDRLYLAEGMPVLIIWGARDPIIPRHHGENAHEAIPGSQLEVFDGVGHLPQLEAPGRFIAVLERFIAENEPASFDSEQVAGLGGWGWGGSGFINLFWLGLFRFCAGGGFVWLSGGFGLLLCRGLWGGGLAMLAIPIVTLSARFSSRGILNRSGDGARLTVAVAFGVNAIRFSKTRPCWSPRPPSWSPSAMLSTALMHSDVQHRSGAVIDQLTGLLNRNALEARADELEQQSAITGQPIAVIVRRPRRLQAGQRLGVGHASGDAVLKEVAYLVRKRLRAFDLAYRLGGDEFLVLVPGADLESAATLAEELREAVGGETVGRVAGDHELRGKRLRSA